MGRKKETSDARECGHFFKDLTGTSKLVPFRFVQVSELFFSKLEGQVHNKAVTAAPRHTTQNRLQNRGFPRTAGSYFAVTSECVMACTDSAMRFCTPTLRISFAT
jgi:hypothetical protein